MEMMQPLIEKKPKLDIAEAQSLIAMSNDLILKSQWPRLTINEQRLILYMLALVEKGDDDFKTYKVSVQELGNILGVKHKDLYAQFDQATDGLMGKIIRWIEAPYTQDETLRKVTWCSSAGLTKGQGFVEISFNPHLKPFLLALKGRFTLYELRAVIRLQNHYSLRLYQFLKYNEGMARRTHDKSITVSLEWLKEYLDADNPSYARYGSFRQKVLLPSQKDLEKNTDLLFDFTSIKTSRKVTSLEFIWKHNPDYDQQIMPFMKAPLPQEQAPPEHISDGIGNQLQTLGFDDWQKIRDTFTDQDWQLAFDDLEYNQKTTDQNIKSPGGWLRARLKSSQPGQPYQPSQAYQKHQKKEHAKHAKVRREKKKWQETQKINRLLSMFESERDRILKDLLDKYTSKQTKEFTAWVGENYPDSDFIKPFQEDGQPNPMYLKSFLIARFSPQYDSFIDWAQKVHSITLKEESGGYRIIQQQSQAVAT